MINRNVVFALRLIWVAVWLFISLESFPQKADTLKFPNHFGGSVTLTSNGISTIPNFILGKPAAILYMSVGRRISFEPEFRISLDAKPWMFIFWWRADLLKSQRHYIRSGVNYQLNFDKVQDTDNGITNEKMAANRYLTADLSQSYFITKNISAGIYYMYSHTLEKYGLRDLHYIAFRGNFSNLRLSEQWFMKFTPQVYYLRLEDKDGFYFSETLLLARRNFPFSVSSIITAPVGTHIMINNHLLWNVNLIYSFNNEYSKKK